MTVQVLARTLKQITANYLANLPHFSDSDDTSPADRTIEMVVSFTEAADYMQREIYRLERLIDSEGVEGVLPMHENETEDFTNQQLPSTDFTTVAPTADFTISNINANFA